MVHCSLYKHKKLHYYTYFHKTNSKERKGTIYRWQKEGGRGREGREGDRKEKKEGERERERGERGREEGGRKGKEDKGRKGKEAIFCYERLYPPCNSAKPFMGTLDVPVTN